MSASTTSAPAPFFPVRLDPWPATAIVVAAVTVLPVAAVIWLALFPTENVWSHLVATVLPGYVLTTIVLMAGVAIGVLLFGVGAAWLVTMCRFPGRRLLGGALMLPFAVPAYVIAYVYTDLLEYAGPVQSAIRHVFGFSAAKEYWFPEIRSLGGAIAMMTLVLYPYTYLLSRASFLEQSATSLQAARSLGRTPLQSFLGVSLPIARPAIAAGTALALMETLNDYGTVDYFAVHTLTTGIYDTWLGMGNLGGGAQIAASMLVFVIILLTVERLSRKRGRQHQTHARHQALPGYFLRGWRSWAAFTFCCLPILLGFVVPASLLALYAYTYIETSLTDRFLSYAGNSLFLSCATAFLSVAVAVFLTYAARLHPSMLLRVAVGSASLGYALPGAVLALGVIVPLSALDNLVDGLAREWLGISTGLVLSGTLFAILFAYLIRFLAVALSAVESSLSKITPNMEYAARSLGHGAGATLIRVHVPIMRPGLLTAGLIVFVDCMKELPATLILRPFNFDTLATYVYQFASDELLEECALGALLIVSAGLIPIILLNRSISRTRALE